VSTAPLHADQMQKAQKISNSISLCCPASVWQAVQHLSGKSEKLSCEAEKTSSVLGARSAVRAVLTCNDHTTNCPSDCNVAAVPTGYVVISVAHCVLAVQAQLF